MPAEPSCPHCLEPVAATARVCPHCRNATLADVVIGAPVADSRMRYQVARALSLVGSGAPGLTASQNALSQGGRLLRGALPGLAQSCAAILEERGVAFSVEPAGTGGKPPDRGSAAGGNGLVIAAAATVVVLALGAFAVWRRASTPARSAVQRPVAERPGDLGPRLSGADLAARALPSTVAIHCPDSVGTGFFVAPGRVLTNSHVTCSGGEDMVVRLPSGKEGSGRVLQADERLDLALVAVEGLDAPPLPLGDAGSLRVGDRVMVVGSPKGMEFSVTQGVVSNLDRIFLGIAMIQTDAPINPGNSGGPLVDERGGVVGIVSLKRLDAEGISLALPINYAFSGPHPLFASPSSGESEGFKRMVARAEAQDQADAAELGASAQLPGVVGATASGTVVLASILFPSAYDPGTQGFDFDLLRDGTAVCSAHGVVSEWQKAEEANGGRPVLNPRAKAWLEDHGLASDIWVGGAMLRFDQCPGGVYGPNMVLEMHGADPAASRVQF
jgi:S1-C subfamily serine protease